MSIYLDLKNELSPNTRKCLDLTKEIDSSLLEETTSKDADNDTIDEKIEKNNFVTPAEYYSTQMSGTHGSSDKSKEGYYNLAGNNDITIKWFWCEDLKNWCSYLVYSNSLFNNINLFFLQVWNGKDGWIPIPNLYLTEDEDSLKKDKYGIAPLQDYFLEKARDGLIADGVSGVNKNVILQFRGIQQTVGPGNPTPNPSFYSIPSNRLHHLVGLRLQKAVKYSINDTNNFQTIRWNTLYSPVDKGKEVNLGRFAQGNFRVPVTIGIPPVWRLPTGEICLAASFYYNSDGGIPYGYRRMSTGDEFRKYFLKTDDNSIPWTLCNNILGSNDFEGAAWINSICANFFGTGNDKTIEKDWLREKEKSDVDVIDYSASYDNMLDSEKVFEQHNINKENSIKIKFTINRPVVTTEENTTSDYAKRW